MSYRAPLRQFFITFFERKLSLKKLQKCQTFQDMLSFMTSTIRKYRRRMERCFKNFVDGFRNTTDIISDLQLIKSLFSNRLKVSFWDLDVYCLIRTLVSTVTNGEGNTVRYWIWAVLWRRYVLKNSSQHSSWLLLLKFIFQRLTNSLFHRSSDKLASGSSTKSTPKGNVKSYLFSGWDGNNTPLFKTWKRCCSRQYLIL